MGTVTQMMTAVERGQKTRRRVLRRLTGSLLVLLPLLYLGIAAVAADRLSRPVRYALTSTPADYGLTYEDVSFNSTVDSIPLSGWYIDSPGKAVIVMMHGRDGRRDGGSALEIAALLGRHGYDVLAFDFRAHGASGGECYSMGLWEQRDVAGALGYLKGRGVDHVGVYANSMGASTALLAAVDHPEMGPMLLDSPFADLPQLLEVQLPRVSGLPA